MLLNSMWNKPNNSLLLHCLSLHRASHVSKSHGPTECVMLKNNLHAHITSFSSSCCNCSWPNVAFNEFCNRYLPSTYHMLMNQQLNEITSHRCCIWYYLPQDFFFQWWEIVHDFECNITPMNLQRFIRSFLGQIHSI